MVTLYTPKKDFRDSGNTWYGRWGYNKQNACRGNGFGIGYDKGFYSEPREESCSSGGPVMAMDQLNGMTDPNIKKMEEAYEKDPTGGSGE